MFPPEAKNKKILDRFKMKKLYRGVEFDILSKVIFSI